MKIRVIDVETTGFDPEKDSVVEIGSVDIIGPLDNEPSIGNPMETLIRPAKSDLTPETMAVHHITPPMLKDAPVFDYAATLFKGADIYVAHNAKFDSGFLPMLGPWICTYKVALQLWPDAPSHSNQALRYWKGIYDLSVANVSVKHAHRALYDATTTSLLFKLLLLNDVTIDQMLQWTLEPALLQKVPFGKHRCEKWDDIPESYLKWIIKQKDMNEDVVFTAKQTLKKDK